MADYAGEVFSEQAWEALKKDERAVLVDVRTKAEWTYVGVCDLSELGKKPVFLPWQVYPEMAVNPDFVAQLEAAGIDKETPLYFICRSGSRSRAAAAAAAEAGFERCYNVSDGFEGDADPNRHRGRLNGWKASDLPWVQS